MTRSYKNLPTESKEELLARHEWKQKRADARKREAAREAEFMKRQLLLKPNNDKPTDN